ncbi:hypothetical protein DEG02_008745 [Xanthomonas vasicola]|nr:hypothetical protein KWO_013030 [Xanthomonas vasicola pv. musacearum NCPPB 4379]RJL83744.1 hypothetical protein DEG03_009835 [Xanthomonas vasicola]RRJ41462.1 hypothetical protein EIM46_08625 [Xanthomonas vasicola pv. musacearum]RJL85426.1 hypothetical protein DEF98_012335 [Xanthomonas vasicola]RJL90648.1 hypothetical protein DEF95_009145 [Xanthomonas vasicola]
MLRQNQVHARLRTQRARGFQHAFQGDGATLRACSSEGIRTCGADVGQAHMHLTRPCRGSQQRTMS